MALTMAKMAKVVKEKVRVMVKTAMAMNAFAVSLIVFIVLLWIFFKIC